MGKAFKGLNKRLIKFGRGGQVVSGFFRGLIWDGVPVPVSRFPESWVV
jgi:hypothetical protein